MYSFIFKLAFIVEAGLLIISCSWTDCCQAMMRIMSIKLLKMIRISRILVHSYQYLPSKQFVSKITSIGRYKNWNSIYSFDPNKTTLYWKSLIWNLIYTSFGSNQGLFIRFVDFIFQTSESVRCPVSENFKYF